MLFSNAYLSLGGKKTIYLDVIFEDQKGSLHMTSTSTESFMVFSKAVTVLRDLLRNTMIRLKIGWRRKWTIHYSDLLDEALEMVEMVKEISQFKTW